ncbi:MAG TPA: DNA mismatch repair endonuclease MutL [bacterium]
MIIPAKTGNAEAPAAAALTRRIHLLPEEVHNRIAAGEVVERPASVLKELIENSLDAGAQTIDVSLAGAGQKEICVSDDGAGMGREDLLLAFERHATSKVAKVEDLLEITTLGFRGEALAAIASVSRIEAISRPREHLQAHRLRLHGGKISGIEEAGAPQGTTIAVRDLFFNTPARKKFLKSAAVENGHLLAVFKRYALAYPQVRWSLTQDGKTVYRLPPESLENQLLAVFSEDLKSQLFPVEAEDSGIHLYGFIGAPGLARRSRGDQHIFINRRWVQHRLLGHAIVSGYGTLLETGQFPFYVLFFDVPPSEVDVNVHPAKTEVKLRRENELYGFTANAILGALQKAGLSAMSMLALKPGETVNRATGEITAVAAGGAYQSFRPAAPAKAFQPEAYQIAFGERIEPTSESPPSPASVSVETGGERTLVYQIHQRYILTEIKGGMAIIDQHAAHERILYEKALKALNGGAMPSQQLLFPRIVELDAENAVRLREVLADLQALGISIREFGERSFALEALPSGIQPGLGEEIVKEILDELRERGVARRPGQEPIAAAFACRAAIKFGQPLALAEMNALIDQLFATKFPFTCPHGRPTLLKLTLSELERRFGR